MFIFRNNTIEGIFGTEGVEYSGYEDISYVPKDIDLFLWFYQLPIKWNQQQLAGIIDSYASNLQLVFSKIPQSATFIALTMEDILPTRYSDADTDVRESLARYNATLYEMAKANRNFKIFDFSEFTNRYDANELIAWKFYFISQMYLSPKVVPAFRQWFDLKMKGVALKRKKCLVLDLDNTLWGGVLGEDGIEGIKIGGEYPGKAFLYFQEAILHLSKQGIILSVCSKNNEVDVKEAWEKNPFILLKEEHFSAKRINWQDKATNIVELSKELNIGLDSMVFVDDNPTERELIKQTLPMVEVPEFPKQPYMLPDFFLNLLHSYFAVYEITDEDRKKTEQYKANAERLKEQSKFLNFDDYLKSLDIKIEIQQANQFNLSRIAQMTQKTNQFNLTTKRMTESEVANFIKESGKVFCISVSDKFGDNGITGAIFISGNSIENLLLSCRILGKGIEIAFVKAVFKTLVESGETSLSAKYIPTLKNSQVSDFYDKLGFSLQDEEDGVKHYEVNLRELDLNIPNYYNITIK